MQATVLDHRHRGTALAMHFARAILLGLVGFAATAALWFGMSFADPQIGSPIAAEIICAVLFAMSQILNCGQGRTAGVLRRIIVAGGAFIGYVGVVFVTAILLFGPGPVYRKGDQRPAPDSSSVPFFLFWAGFVVLMFAIRTLWARNAPPKEPAGPATDP